MFVLSTPFLGYMFKLCIKWPIAVIFSNMFTQLQWEVYHYIQHLSMEGDSEFTQKDPYWTMPCQTTMCLAKLSWIQLEDKTECVVIMVHSLYQLKIPNAIR